MFLSPTPPPSFASHVSFSFIDNHLTTKQQLDTPLCAPPSLATNNVGRLHAICRADGAACGCVSGGVGACCGGYVGVLGFAACAMNDGKDKRRWSVGMQRDLVVNGFDCCWEGNAELFFLNFFGHVHFRFLLLFPISRFRMLYLFPFLALSFPILMFTMHRHIAFTLIFVLLSLLACSLAFFLALSVQRWRAS